MRYCSDSERTGPSRGIQSGRITVLVVVAILVLIAAGVIGFLKFSGKGHGMRRVRMRVPPRPVVDSPVQIIQPDTVAVHVDDGVAEIETAVVETEETASGAMPAVKAPADDGHPDEAPVVVPSGVGEAEKDNQKAVSVDEEDEPASVNPESVPDMNVEDTGLNIPPAEISPDGSGPEQEKNDQAPDVTSSRRQTTVQESKSRELGYYVSVASFRDKASADRLIARLIDEGLDAYSSYVELPEGKGNWYRVYIGPSLGKREAIDLADSLEGKYFSPWVVPPWLGRK